jgi:hypothetical protein
MADPAAARAGTDRQLPAAGGVANILRKYLRVQERPYCHHQRD